MKKYLNLFLAAICASLLSMPCLSANGVVESNKSKIAIVNAFHDNLEQSDVEAANDLLFIPLEIQTKEYREPWFKLLKSLPITMKNRGWPKWEPQCEKTLTEAAVVLINHNSHNELDPFFLLKHEGQWLISPAGFFGDYKFKELVFKHVSDVKMRELHELRGWSLKVIRGYPGFECTKDMGKK